MIGRCIATTGCPFENMQCVDKEKECIFCELCDINGIDIANQLGRMVEELRSNGKEATKIYMRMPEFLKLIADYNDVICFMRDGEPHYRAIGCEIEVRDDLAEDVLLYVE